MYLDNEQIWRWKHVAKTTKETGYEHVIDALNIISVEDFINTDNKDYYVKEVLKLIREVNVYPIYYYNAEGIHEEIKKCFDAAVYFGGDTLVEHGRAGSTLLDFMFPNLHLAEAGCAVDNCMYKRFYDDTKLYKCLHRHMKNYPFTSMRTPFFMYGRFFWSTPTNFNTMRAKAIYQKFCTPDSVVYDFSSGYGGRMLGAMSAHVKQYIGCEPNLNTYINLCELGERIEEVSGKTDSFSMLWGGSEDVELESNIVDFAFSCPPYFGLERYSKEDTQSYTKFRKYEDWLQGYVYPTLANIRAALKPDGLLAIVLPGSVTHLQKKYELGNDWADAARACGFVLDKVYGIKTMSRKDDKHAEALYVFKKGR